MEEQHPRNKEALRHLYDNVLPALAGRIHEHLAPVITMFNDFRLERLVDTWSKDADTELISIDKGNVPRMGLRLQLLGFHRAGVAPFDISRDLVLELEQYSYEVKADKHSSWLTKPYRQNWTATELEEVTERWCGQLIELITERLQNPE